MAIDSTSPTAVRVDAMPATTSGLAIDGLLRRVARAAARATARVAAIGNYDFCPSFNRYVYWLKQPIGWLLVAAAAAAMVGAWLAPAGWWMCGVLTTVTAFGLVWPWLSMRGVSAELTFERRRCHERDEVTVGLVVTNRWPWPVWGLLVERGFSGRAAVSGEADDGAATALARVSGWSRSRFEFPFEPERRGVYPLETPQIANGFPFGIWTARRPVGGTNRLIVWPRCATLRSAPRLKGERPTPVGALLERAGDDGDLFAARPFRDGDSLRRVHWAHTARRDTLIVCERQATARRQVVVRLDGAAFARRAAAGGAPATLDDAVRVTASLCRELQEHSCELVCMLDDEAAAVAPGPAGLQKLFDRLASYSPPASTATCWEPSGLTNSRASGAAGERSRAERGAALTICVTTAEGWVSTSGGGGRRQAAGERRGVVIDEPTGDEPTGETEPEKSAGGERPWLRLTAGEACFGQLQRQWERQCHGDWSVD